MSTSRPRRHGRAPRSRSRFGNVRRLPSGQWQARFREAGEDKIPYPGITYATEREAWEALENFSVDRRRGIPDTPTADITLAEFANNWVELHTQDTAESTADSYKSIVRAYITRPGTPLSDTAINQITPMMIREWLRTIGQPWLDARGTKPVPRKGAAASTRKKAFVILNMIFKAAKGERHLSVNPCDDIQPVARGQVQAERREHYYLYLTEIIDIISAAHEDPRGGPDWAEFFTATFWSGCRPGEIRALWGEQLIPGRNIINVNAAISKRTRNPYTKNSDSRLAYVPGPVMSMLQNRVHRLQLGPRDYLWTDSNGGPMWDSTMEAAWGRACRRAGVTGDAAEFLAGRREMPWAYDLRASHISHLLSAGVPASEVGGQVGHQDESTTKLYTVVQVAGLEDPIAVAARTNIPPTRRDILEYLYEGAIRPQLG